MKQERIELFEDQEIDDLKNFLQEIKALADGENEDNSKEFQVIQVVVAKLEALLKNTKNPNQLELPQQVEIMAYITLLHDFLEYFSEDDEYDEDEDEDDEFSLDDENIFSQNK